MNQSRTFVLRTEVNAQMLWDFLRHNWREMAKRESPLSVTIQEHKDKHSHDQRKKWHAMVRDIAQQAWISGRQFDDEVWKEHLKRDFLGMEAVTLPSGEIIERARSTSALNHEEYSELIEQTYAIGAELGVIFEN